MLCKTIYVVEYKKINNLISVDSKVDNYMFVI